MFVYVIVIRLKKLVGNDTKINFLHKVSHINKDVDNNVWRNYFKFVSDTIKNDNVTINVNGVEVYVNINPYFFPNISQDKYDFEFDKKIDTRWFRANCHQIHFGLNVIIEYLVRKVNPDVNVQYQQFMASTLLSQVNLGIPNKRFKANKCRSIHYTPGDNNASLCVGDMAYGKDDKNWWFIYVTQVKYLLHTVLFFMCILCCNQIYIDY